MPLPRSKLDLLHTSGYPEQNNSPGWCRGHINVERSHIILYDDYDNGRFLTMAVLKSTNVRSTWRACAHSGRTATLSYSMSAARTSSGLRSASAMPSAHMRTLRTTKTQSTGPLLPLCAPQESLSHAHSLMFGSGQTSIWVSRLPSAGSAGRIHCRGYAKVRSRSWRVVFWL